MSDNAIANNTIANNTIANNEITNTDIETLLQLKQKLELIIQSLEYIQETGIHLQKPPMDSDIANELTELYSENMINELPVIKKTMQDIMNILNNEIRNTCKHCFEDDYIDILPEKSMPIKYCTKCYLTF
jgi:regulatory protein YycH of two-component signal transduction system YycFG